MKRKNASRITALGLCGTMLLSGATGLTAHASEEEPLSFKVTTVYFGDQSPENTKIQEEWIKLCEEKLGRKLDITFEYIHTGDYTEKLQVINAGGDLPDILTCYSTVPRDFTWILQSIWTRCQTTKLSWIRILRARRPCLLRREISMVRII